MTTIRIKHHTKDGELKVLFEATDTIENKVKGVNIYNYYTSTLESGYLLGYEDDKIVMYHNLDFDKLDGVVVRTSLIET